jgi:DNA (cytosine-5)-methyltransferase 1
MPKKKDSWKTLDLYAGIGGIRIGFENAGFETVFANDFEPFCKITYDLNFKTVPLTVADIGSIDPKKLPDFDVLLAGFPCQPFSIAGYRKGFEDGDRGNQFLNIVRILKIKKPEGFLLENVKNLRGHDAGKTFRIIEEALRTLGYHVKSKVLGSWEYGNIPQNRERIYIVGFKDKKKSDEFEFPAPIPLKKKIDDILEKKVPEKYYYNKSPLFPKLKPFITKKNVAYQWRRRYVRENKKGLFPTLTANMGMGGHNVPLVKDDKGIRKLTPKECLLAQGFPKTYKIPEGIADSRIYKQAGNSVTVTVIERIAKNIAKVMK